MGENVKLLGLDGLEHTVCDLLRRHAGPDGFTHLAHDRVTHRICGASPNMSANSGGQFRSPSRMRVFTHPGQSTDALTFALRCASE